ncbi:MAG: Nitric oxide reductase cytochrome c subunit [Candidatus Accumulibacter adjunctus]|uniref:Nitric oxide reductase cytochrome c subunit n=1 Tax=Candidatus Accumulibacter adjunctus TaxID=1454001 RepID=A0A011NRH3_9PROT|nr:MAG: Nitric oxide reductase cytochrome c subunit [Candidatus Accumulibacter adjunctus]
MARAFRHGCPAEGVARRCSIPQFKQSESQSHEIADFLTYASTIDTASWPPNTLGLGCKETNRQYHSQAVATPYFLAALRLSLRETAGDKGKRRSR